MFRNALRQSTRAVSAISASGRVVAAVSVSQKPPSTRKELPSHQKRGMRSISMDINDICEVQLSKLEGFYGQFKSLKSSGGKKRKRCTNQNGEEELYAVLCYALTIFGLSANLHTCIDTKCRTRRRQHHRPVLRRRCESFSHRGLLYPRAKNPWCC